MPVCIIFVKAVNHGGVTSVNRLLCVRHFLNSSGLYIVSIAGKISLRHVASPPENTHGIPINTDKRWQEPEANSLALSICQD